MENDNKFNDKCAFDLQMDMSLLLPFYHNNKLPWVEKEEQPQNKHNLSFKLRRQKSHLILNPQPTTNVTLVYMQVQIH